MHMITRESAAALLKKYNQEPFHLQHAYTVEGVMRWFAADQVYADEADFWALAGLLHDVDWEAYPDQHCQKAPELLEEIGADEKLVHAVCSHGYGLVSDCLLYTSHAVGALKAGDAFIGVRGRSFCHEGSSTYKLTYKLVAGPAGSGC